MTKAMLYSCQVGVQDSLAEWSKALFQAPVRKGVGSNSTAVTFSSIILFVRSRQGCNSTEF